MDTRQYWDRFYEQNPYKNSREPNEFVRSRVADLPKGRVLDLAMGEGQNAVFLASEGFQVDGLDISQVAIDRSTAFAYEKGVKINAKRSDLDMHLFELMAYDSVIMIDFKPALSRYYDEIVRSLKYGGRLLIEAELFGSLASHGPDAAHKFFFKSNELLSALKGLCILYYSELEGTKDRRLVRCIAEKPSHKDAQKFGFFDMQTKGRETEKSVHLQAAEALFKK